MEELGFVNGLFSYNRILSLYSQMCSYSSERDGRKGIDSKIYIFNIWLDSYAAPILTMDYHFYAVKENVFNQD